MSTRRWPAWQALRTRVSISATGSITLISRSVLLPTGFAHAGNFPACAKPVGKRTEREMSVIDPVADMLTRVRNACQAGHRRVDMPVSKLKVEIARLLRDNHYIQDFKALDDGRHGLLRLYLKYHNDAPVIRELVRVSAPGLRRYVKAREIPRVKNGLGMAILSTPQGVMSDREARTAHVGGELLAVVW